MVDLSRLEADRLLEYAPENQLRRREVSYPFQKQSLLMYFEILGSLSKGDVRVGN